jgi:hypothetical protein
MSLEEGVAGQIFKVDELDRLRAAVVPLGQTIGHRALEQQFRRCLVHFHQPVRGRLLQIANSAGDAHVIQPRLPVAQIQLSSAFLLLHLLSQTEQPHVGPHFFKCKPSILP